MVREIPNLNLALPHDLIVEILLRLPVRSLMRFKCVCTSWRSLISHPEFAKSHFDRDPSPTHRLLLNRVNGDSQIQSLDIEASLHVPSAVVNLNFPRAPYFLTMGSCRGLMLLTKDKDPTLDDLIVWNPSTGSHREIPVTYADWDQWYHPSTSARVRQKIPPFNSILAVKNNSLLYSDLYGFGYDPSNDDYLLVVIRLGICEPEVTNPSLPRIGVLSLQTSVPSFYCYCYELDYMEIGPWTLPGVYLSQSLHWSVTSLVTHDYAVIAFDLVDRSLSEIALSDDLAEELGKHAVHHLGVMGGCLSLCYPGGDLNFPDEVGPLERTEIWVMKEYKVQSSWTKCFVLSSHATPFSPIWLTEGGCFVGSDHSGGLHKYNNNEELIENQAFGLEDEFGLKYFDMYRESLLPLPGEEENEDA